jgi:hypothetical protein
MLTRTAPIAAVLTLVALAAGVAKAATIHKFTATDQLGQVSTTGGFPNVGGSIVTAGPVKTKGIGSGVDLTKNTVTARPTPNVLKTKGTATDFYARGSVKSVFTATFTVNADGSVTFAATGRYTGGTGAYRGASGKFTATGFSAANTTVASFQLKGTLKY